MAGVPLAQTDKTGYPQGHPSKTLDPWPPFMLLMVLKGGFMTILNPGDVLTKTTRYNLMRNGKSLYIDVHELIEGTLAGQFIAVPNLIMILASAEFQGAGDTAEDALEDCLKKIAGLSVEEIFPQQQ